MNDSVINNSGNNKTNSGNTIVNQLINQSIDKINQKHYYFLMFSTIYNSFCMQVAWPSWILSFHFFLDTNFSHLIVGGGRRKV